MRGRLQRFERDGVEVVVDVGHNPQAARELAAWLAAAPAQRAHARGVRGARRTRTWRAWWQALAPQVAHWHLAGLVEAGPRGGSVDAFAARLAGTPAATATRHAQVAERWPRRMRQAQPGDRILVFGSFHTAAAALEWLARD